MQNTKSSMKAVLIEKYGSTFAYTDRQIPVPEPNEVLIKVMASGLCSTDAHILEGRMDLGVLPRIPGHEVAGIIVKTGSAVRNWHIDQRVTVAIDINCGKCRHCLTGHTHRCSDLKRIGFERDGGHAEYVVVPQDNLVSLPANISFDAGAILPDAVACMYHCLISQGKIRIHDKILILGAGGLGMHGIQIAKLAGAEIIATSRNEARLAMAATYGAIAVNPNSGELENVVRDMTNAEGLDVVADCIGSRESIRQGLSLVRPGGKVLVIGYIDEEFTIPSIDLFLHEKELIGCRGSTKRDLTEVTKLVSKGKIAPLIGQHYHLSEINNAVESLEKGNVIGRIVLQR
jgi:propanol-preferring alcohol dehydrogenase